MDTQLRIAYYRGMLDFWRRHLPPGWTIGGYSCDEFERIVNQLEAVEREIQNTIQRLFRAEADFDEMLANAEQQKLV